MEKASAPNKQKRDKRIFAVSAAAVLLIIAYILFIIFRGNPLLCTWKEQEKAYTLTFEKDGDALLTKADTLASGSVMTVAYSYELNQNDHTLSLTLSSKAIESLAEDTGRDLADADFKQQVLDLQEVCGSYDYTVKGNSLTLEDREAGTQITLTKD